jgi:general secretion pathway protein K
VSGSERGAALLVVMVAVALVTALAMDLAYQARVGLQIAANGRDELVALTQARGAVNLSRLVLHFQVQLDAQSAGMVGALSAAGGAAGAGAIPRIQVWKLIPIDSMLASNLFAGNARRDGAAAGAGHGGASGGEVAAAHGAAGIVAGTGGFTATIDDEDRKVNAQFDGLAQGGLLAGQLASFMALVTDRRWDPLFEREDANGVKQNRNELAANLRDWTDTDTQQSAVTGVPGRPFENGFGDENYLYDRGPDRYKAKNARFDSMEELYMVAGLSDLHMAAFGERLTVYLGPSAKMNVNTDDSLELLIRAGMAADPPIQPIFSDPTFPDRLLAAVKLVRMGGFVTMSPQQFAAVLTSLGVGVNTIYSNPGNSAGGAFIDRSFVFRIRGQGSAGSVVKNVEAVVSFDPYQARDAANDLGRTLHWREE